ncbi:MAG TPA: hypothetical protein VEY95_04670 [Azospirillaceae bacterium]|nr:hypothetical protein [Azospirillaceae bacterium]
MPHTRRYHAGHRLALRSGALGLAAAEVIARRLTTLAGNPHGDHGPELRRMVEEKVAAGTRAGAAAAQTWVRTIPLLAEAWAGQMRREAALASAWMVPFPPWTAWPAHAVRCAMGRIELVRLTADAAAGALLAAVAPVHLAAGANVRRLRARHRRVPAKRPRRGGR